MSLVRRSRAFIARWRYRLHYLRLETRARLDTLRELGSALAMRSAPTAEGQPLVLVGDRPSAVYVRLIALSPRVPRLEVRVVEDGPALVDALTEAGRRPVVIAGDLYARHHVRIAATGRAHLVP